MNSEGKYESLTILSQITGWIYFVVWSISFYGQTYTNWKLKSVEGMKFDYIAYNITGYLFYGIANTFGYFGNPSKTGLPNVSLQDLLFTYHGEILVFVKVIQCFIYKHGENKLSKYCIVILSIMWAYIISYCLLTNVFNVFNPPLDLNTLHQLGYVKLVITLIKYFPQAYWNYIRKSTFGWSIFNVICDITGGFFSILQDIIDTYNGDTSVFGGLNTVKFLLGILTIIFDLVFLTQHYCLYPQKKQKSIDNLEKIDYEKMDNEISDNNDNNERQQSEDNTDDTQKKNQFCKDSQQDDDKIQ